MGFNSGFKGLNLEGDSEVFSYAQFNTSLRNLLQSGNTEVSKRLLYSAVYNYELSATRTGRLAPRKQLTSATVKERQDRGQWFRLLTQIPTLQEIKSNNSLSTVWIELLQNEMFLRVVSMYILRTAESGFGPQRKFFGAPTPARVSRVKTFYTNTLLLFQLDTHFYFPNIFLQFSSYNFPYMFRTGWSIIRRIKLHAQPLVPFPSFVAISCVAVGAN